MPLIGGRGRFGVVIVVPSFTTRDDGHPRIVAAVVVGLVVAVAEQLRKGGSAPGDMPNQDGSDDDAPEPYTCGKFQAFPDRPAQRSVDHQPPPHQTATL